MTLCMWPCWESLAFAAHTSALRQLPFVVTTGMRQGSTSGIRGPRVHAGELSVYCRPLRSRCRGFRTDRRADQPHTAIARRLRSTASPPQANRTPSDEALVHARGWPPLALFCSCEALAKHGFEQRFVANMCFAPDSVSAEIGLPRHCSCFSHDCYCGLCSTRRSSAEASADCVSHPPRALSGGPESLAPRGHPHLLVLGALQRRLARSGRVGACGERHIAQRPRLALVHDAPIGRRGGRRSEPDAVLGQREEPRARRCHRLHLVRRLAGSISGSSLRIARCPNVADCAAFSARSACASWHRPRPPSMSIKRLKHDSAKEASRRTRSEARVCAADGPQPGVHGSSRAPPSAQRAHQASRRVGCGASLCRSFVCRIAFWGSSGKCANSLRGRRSRPVRSGRGSERRRLRSEGERSG